ncbi:HET-domain-containing protein [Xylariaceae sp. AK1471]|nr:HET-domain-containing protein [Xylariaceae sp. AK1471]
MRFLHFTPNGDHSLTKDLINNHPQYAILSHTWGNEEDEVMFDDIMDRSTTEKVGYRKIKFCMERAIQDGLQFSWVDTCCIRKSDAVELGRAINSMFRWYKNASRCYVYLDDVSADGEEPRPDIRWFTRGWTLQELIAPESVEFFSSDGKFLGDKDSLAQILCDITKIPVHALHGRPLSDFSIPERMSWAGTRSTTLEEDKIYSLLGLFDINLPLIYGEGEHNARERLLHHRRRGRRRP